MRKPVLLITFGYLLLNLLACSTLDRSASSGYSGRGSSSSNSQKKYSISHGADSFRAPDAPMSQKTRLKQLENSLSSKKETEQYSKALANFKDDAERIDFLSLPGFEARQKWLRENDFNSRSSRVIGEMQELVMAQDIAIGMPQALVKQSWGDPDAVEVSGNPQFKNERWRYNKFISTPDGFKPEKKLVYFEGGKVVGWEVE